MGVLFVGYAVPDSFAAVGALFNPALSGSSGAAGGSVSETSSGLDASSDAVSETLAAAAGTGIGGVWLFASVCFFAFHHSTLFKPRFFLGFLVFVQPQLGSEGVQAQMF